MVISNISSMTDEVSDLAALILLMFDMCIDNLLASFNHLARADTPDKDALFAKLRNLAFKIVSRRRFA